MTDALTPHGANRAGREICFRIFSNIAKDTFEQLASADEAHMRLARLAWFYVIPGGRNGGVDERIVDVFYGNRSIGRDFHAPGQLRSAVESGAMLRYSLQDDGSVLCMLHPSTSSNRQRKEDAIVYRLIRDPCVLTSAPTLDRHRRALRSYFEYCSVDGRPTVIDRFRVWWLLLTRKMVIDSAIVPRWWWRGTNKIVTIGFNGFVGAAFLFWLTWYLGYFGH
jgi:hypothetical protein